MSVPIRIWRCYAFVYHTVHSVDYVLGVGHIRLSDQRIADLQKWQRDRANNDKRNEFAEKLALTLGAMLQTPLHSEYFRERKLGGANFEIGVYYSSSPFPGSDHRC